MEHDVHVLVPGILGSVLQRNGDDIFGLTAGAGFRALFSAGRSIQSLTLSETPMAPHEAGNTEPVAPVDLGDGVRASRLAADAHLVPGLWKIDGYTAVREFLLTKLNLVPGESYFEFPYDWRRDNRVAAHLLAKSCHEWLQRRRQQHPDARLVLLGHSMGGLVSRYYLEVLGGWRLTRRLVTFGTPYRGSLNAVDFAANGFARFFGLVDLTDLLCSFTSVQQLLPIYRCIDVGDTEMARLTEAPHVLPRLTPEQISAARAFHREIEDAVTRNRQDQEYLDHGYQVRPVIGIEQPTNQSARWHDGRLEILRDYAGDDLGGDGTVPRVSASPQEAENDQSAMFSGDKHASLQNAEGVHTQVRGWMKQIDLGDFMAGAPVTVAVDTAEVHRLGEPVAVRLIASSATAGLTVSLTWVGGPVDTVSTPAEVNLPLVDPVAEVQLPVSEPGVYRLRVTGDEIEPVTDLLTVAPG